MNIGQSKRTLNDDNNDDGRDVKRRRTIDQPSSGSSLALLDLPKEILQQTFSYSSTVSDRFALQCTSAVFREISNSSEVLQTTTLLLTTAAHDNDDDSAVIKPSDSSLEIALKLLPFAKAANLDALLILGLIATYGEDDLETGLALFQKGVNEGDNRAKLELANLLLKDRKNMNNVQDGDVYTNEVDASGHTCLQTQNVQRATRCLRYLLARKPTPPNSKWAPVLCGNPLCTRMCYGKANSRALAWMKNKTFSSSGWYFCRSKVLACGSPSPYFCRETFFSVPIFFVCGGCRQEDYCSETCQRIHWKAHKPTCRLHRPN
jgi:hypothetical protein